MTKSELLKQFKKGEVTFDTTGGDRPVEVTLDTTDGDRPVKALIYKGLAVCQMPAGWVNSGKWSITHVKSGVSVNCGIGPWPKQYRWKALFLAWALAQEADWTVSRSKILRRSQQYKAAQNKAMQYVLNKSKIELS